MTVETSKVIYKSNTWKISCLFFRYIPTNYIYTITMEDDNSLNRGKARTPDTGPDSGQYDKNDI